VKQVGRAALQIFLPLISLFCVILSDQYLKNWVLDDFRVGSIFPVIPGWLNITYARNTGAALGLFSGTGPSTGYFAGLTFAALLAIGGLIFFIRPLKLSLAIAFSFSLIVGGALGNLIDRFRFGFVVDFLDFHWHYGYHFPAFNFADLTIALGVLFLAKELSRVSRSI
jgi:signal peptidase II